MKVDFTLTPDGTNTFQVGQIIYRHGPDGWEVFDKKAVGLFKPISAALVPAEVLHCAFVLSNGENDD